MSGGNQGLRSLSEAQREIMQIVWDNPSISASEVREILCKRRTISRNTVRTLLERMEEKGWLKHQEQGRTHHYSATTNRDAAMGQRVVEVLDQVCGGSPESLMAALIDYRGLNAIELRRIRSMLDAAKSRKTDQGDKK